MKRGVAVFFCLIFSLALLMLRLYMLSVGRDAQSVVPGSTRTVEAVSSRGTIYDREMRPFVNETSRIVAAVSPLPHVPALLRSVTAPDDFSRALAALRSGYPAVVPVSSAVRGRGVHLFRQSVRYGETFLIPHIAGYCDGAGSGVCGLEKSFNDLMRLRSAGVTYALDGVGRLLPGGAERVWDEGADSPRGVVLTLDKALQATVRREMLSSGMRKGAAVLLDVQTGGILAMVSLPEWNVHDLESSLDDPDAPFLNRALNAYSVGSVYKMIVAAAALEQGVSADFAYTCTGQTQQNDVTFHCHLRSGHGTLTLPDALAHSCNTYFIHLARQFSAESLLDLSRRMGLGAPITLAEDIACAGGVLPDETELTTDAARANLAFGQGRLTASPLQIAAATAVIAGDGMYREPRLVAETIDTDGKSTPTQAAAAKRALSPEIARRVRALLVYAAARTEILTFKDCGGKTATAQTGVFKNGKELLNTWYSGFFPAQKPRYVLTILREDGASGARDCVPVFQSIAQSVCDADTRADGRRS